MQDLINKLSYLGEEFISELQKVALIKDVPAKTELIQDGQYIRFIPVMLAGLVKVFTIHDDRELLYYYMQSEESCIMSISSLFKDRLSKIYAVTEEDSKILLIPSDHILKWVEQYPKINHLIYEQYDKRYHALMGMVNQAIFYKLDKRLLDYLQQRISISGKTSLKISHKEIANDLGTAREVISRLLKKFESEGVLRQDQQGIQILHKS